jgi:hypothetical protein
VLQICIYTQIVIGTVLLNVTKPKWLLLLLLSKRLLQLNIFSLKSLIFAAPLEKAVEGGFHITANLI